MSSASSLPQSNLVKIYAKILKRGRSHSMERFVGSNNNKQDNMRSFLSSPDKNVNQLLLAQNPKNSSWTGT
jgi:hypothetical protein